MAKVSNEYLPISVLGTFPSDWQEATLASVCHQVTDGTHDSPKPVAEGGYPLVTGKAIKDRRINFAVTYNISRDEHQKVIDRSKPERDDILFANIGNSIGDLVRVETNQPFSIKNVALFKPDQSKIHPRYLEYFLLSEKVQGFIKGATRGSAQPFIGLSSLRGFPIAVPPMEEQYNIGMLLGAFDDRITLLRETNATLEAIAQALFKSWFVDFDPVRAKMEGRVPESMDEAAAALFPDGLEDSELGAVPTGWRVRRLGDVSSYLSRGISPKYLEDGGVLVLNQKCIRDFSVDYCKGRRHDSSQRKIEGRQVATGDVLVNSTGVGTLGRVAQVLSLPEAAVIVDSHVTIVRPSPNLSWPYLGQFMMRKQPDIEAMGEGSTGQTELSRSKLADVLILVPPEDVLVAFDQFVIPMKQRISLNESGMQNMAKLRDTLLPGLISGQLRLPAAEEKIQLAA